jgi:hypothetical protein
MNNIPDQFIYMLANEKMVNMLSTIEQTMAFMHEYKVKPDDEVKKVLGPVVKQLESWINV